MIKEIKHNLSKNIQGMYFNRQSVQVVFWKDIEKELDYWIKQEEK